MSELHTHNGWYWKREQDGSVTFTCRDKNGRALAHHNVTADEWASVVASVSLRGEDSATFDEARAFHAKPQP